MFGKHHSLPNFVLVVGKGPATSVSMVCPGLGACRVLPDAPVRGSKNNEEFAKPVPVDFAKKLALETVGLEPTGFVCAVSIIELARYKSIYFWWSPLRSIFVI